MEQNTQSKNYILIKVLNTTPSTKYESKYLINTVQSIIIWCLLKKLAYSLYDLDATHITTKLFGSACYLTLF